MKLSLVTTAFMSAPHLEEFHRRATAVARAVAGDDYEIVIVNDASPDDSLEICRNLQRKDPHLVVVDLSRNFGHHTAIMTALSHASGDYQFLIDSDLEEEPELLPLFWQDMRATSADVIFGVQERRKGNWFERWSGELFYRVFCAVTGIPLAKNQVTARLMTSRYVKALLQHQEREIFLIGLWAITGFDQRSRIVNKHSSSPTTYTMVKKLHLAVNSVTSFSNRPLIFIFYIGVFISVLAASYIAYIMFYWLFSASRVSGWASMMASIWLLGGMIISSVGVVGIYLAKVFSETKQRPYSIVKQIYRKNDN